MSQALYDIGASVSLMSDSIFKKLSVEHLKLTTIAIQLDDHLMKHLISA